MVHDECRGYVTANVVVEVNLSAEWVKEPLSEQII